MISYGVRALLLRLCPLQRDTPPARGLHELARGTGGDTFKAETEDTERASCVRVSRVFGVNVRALGAPRGVKATPR